MCRNSHKFKYRFPYFSLYRNNFTLNYASTISQQINTIKRISPKKATFRKKKCSHTSNIPLKKCGHVPNIPLKKCGHTANIPLKKCGLIPNIPLKKCSFT